MRTTVTLEPDVSALINRVMRERGVTFKQAINDAVREGLASGAPARFRTRTADMGEPAVPLEKAVRLAAELEDDEIVRRMSIGS